MRIDKRMLEDLPAWMSKRDDIPPGWLYVGDEEERYLLGQQGQRNILIVGVNPSTASPGEKNLDPTIRKVRKMITEDGCKKQKKIATDSKEGIVFLVSA